MQLPSLKSIKERKEPKAPRSERGEVIGMFLEKLNADRGKYPPLTAARVAMMLSPIKSVKDLRAFYGECLYHKNFAVWFWYCYKQVKKEL